MTTVDLSPAVGDTDQPDLTPLQPVRMPQLGETVIFYQGDHDAAIAANIQYDPATPQRYHSLRGTNGARFHPAVVTRVWTATCVNLVVFLDAQGSTVRTSVTLLPDFESDVHCTNSGWRFRDG